MSYHKVWVDCEIRKLLVNECSKKTYKAEFEPIKKRKENEGALNS
jgi:hypothetical protein